MKYLEKANAVWEELGERMELVAERLCGITKEQDVPAPYDAYFKTVAEYLLLQWEVAQLAKSGKLDGISAEEGKQLNERLFRPFSI